MAIIQIFVIFVHFLLTPHPHPLPPPPSPFMDPVMTTTDRLDLWWLFCQMLGIVGLVLEVTSVRARMRVRV